MLADEMTMALRRIRAAAIEAATKHGRAISLPLVAQGINFGDIVGLPNGSADTSRVEGVDPDLRVRPFFAHGETISIREFVVGALNVEMGLRVDDSELAAADAGKRVVTTSGMVLDGATDNIEGPPQDQVRSIPLSSIISSSTY
jgi:hypothetical protein